LTDIGATLESAHDDFGVLDGELGAGGGDWSDSDAVLGGEIQEEKPAV